MFNSDYAYYDKTPGDDIITLKVSGRPVKHYKFIRYEREKIYDYKYLLTKIQNISKKTYHHILFLKKNNEELKIINEIDWNDYYFNNTLEAFIDSRNVLKIEFELTKNVEPEIDPNEKTINILSHYQSDVFMNKLIGLFNKSDTLQNDFYEYLMKEITTNCNSNKSMVDKVNVRKSASAVLTPKFKEVMKKKLSEVNEKLMVLNKIESNMKTEDINEIGEEAIEDDINNDVKNSLGPEHNNETLQSFVSYYDSEKIDWFRTKMLSEYIPHNNTINENIMVYKDKNET